MVKTCPRPAVNGVASADRVLIVLSSFQVGDTALNLVELVEQYRPDQKHDHAPDGFVGNPQRRNG